MLFCTEHFLSRITHVEEQTPKTHTCWVCGRTCVLVGSLQQLQQKEQGLLLWPRRHDFTCVYHHQCLCSLLQVAQYGWWWGTVGKDINHCISTEEESLAERVEVKLECHLSMITLWECSGHQKGSFKKKYLHSNREMMLPESVLVILRAKG